MTDLALLADRAAFRRNLLLATPGSLLVPVALGAIAVALRVALEPLAILAGAVGWSVALVLRAPVAIGADRLVGRERAQTAVVLASGPAEELVRLAALLILGRSVPIAVSLGLGWAAIEVVYALVNGAALLALMGRDDPEAERARALLPSAAMTAPSAPLWGVVERVWASALHVGFALLIAAAPVLVLATIVAHSATNVIFVGLMRAWPLLRVQLAGAAWALVVLLAAAAAVAATGIGGTP